MYPNPDCDDQLDAEAQRLFDQLVDGLIESWMA